MTVRPDAFQPAERRLQDGLLRRLNADDLPALEAPVSYTHLTLPTSDLV